MVTGSRDWTDEATIRKAFKPIRQKHHPDDVVLVSGACPTGADRICELIAHDNLWRVERHPADWERYGTAAGPIRNEEMVRAGADQVLAFRRAKSRGTGHTIELAQTAGLPVTVYEAD